MRLPILVLLAMLVAPAAEAANNWPQFRFDETHQGAVPAIDNSEFVPFKEKWWNNVSIQGPVGSPAVRENIVYFGDGAGFLYAFDQESGGMLWRNTTGASARISGTPAVGQDFVYVVNEGGNLYSFTRKTGQLQTGYPIPVGATFGSILLHGDADALYVGSADGSVKSYFASTRQLRWQFSTAITVFNTTCGMGSVDGTPVLFEQWVLFGSTNFCFFAMPRSPTTSPPTPTWIFKGNEAIRSSPAIDMTNRRVVFGDVSGTVYSIPVASSGKVFSATWMFQEPLIAGRSSEFKASPAIVGDKVIVASRNGNVRALSASFGTPMWVKNVNGEVTSSPAVANGRILVGSFDSKMYMLNVTDGLILETRQGLEKIETSPAISGTQGFWGSTDGTLYSYGGTKPPRADLDVVSLETGVALVGVTGGISATVRNRGVLPSNATTATFFVGGQTIAEVPVPALAPGNTTTLSALYTPTAPGELTFRVFVDSTRTIRESDESNNEKSIKATVSVAAPPAAPTAPTDTDAPGFTAAGLLAMVVLGIVLARTRRR